MSHYVEPSSRVEVKLQVTERRYHPNGRDYQEITATTGTTVYEEPVRDSVSDVLGDLGSVVTAELDDWVENRKEVLNGST